MDFFRVQGARRLEGSIAPMGNKNSALPLLAAAVLTDDPLEIGNMPDIGDVRTKLALLRSLGVEASMANGVCALNASAVRNALPEQRLASGIRTAVLLAAPLLARFGEARIHRPGGDRIGRRRLDTHLIALQALGVDVAAEDDCYVLRCPRLRGADIFLDEMSVTGTEQAIFAAVLAEGTTTIANAAMEPHVQDVCRCLNAMARASPASAPTTSPSKAWRRCTAPASTSARTTWKWARSSASPPPPVRPSASAAPTPPSTA